MSGRSRNNPAARILVTNLVIVGNAVVAGGLAFGQLSETSKEGTYPNVSEEIFAFFEELRKTRVIEEWKGVNEPVQRG